MKFLILVLLSTVFFVSRAQTWTPKSSLTGVSRSFAVGFVIGSKAYIGTGHNGSSSTFLCRDFWEWDQATDTWTQKADFGGTHRYVAAGFSIGKFGYIGTGYTYSGVTNDFWEWNQNTNTWAPKAVVPGGGRNGAIGFSIGNVGYIGTGYDASVTYFSDLWEFNPIANTWTQKANFPGGGRQSASAFSIGNKGYVGLGQNSTIYKNDFWEYDPLQNVWQKKSDFGGNYRSRASGFSSNGKGYFCNGSMDTTLFNDVWVWDPSMDTWTQLANFTGTPRSLAVGFAIGPCGYLATGWDGIPLNELWECCDLTSVKEIVTDNDVVIFPTINDGSFQILINNPRLVFQSMTVYDSQGKSVYKASAWSERVNLNSIRSGVLFVRLEFRGGDITKRLIVRR